MKKTHINLSNLREIEEKCQALGVGRVTQDLPKKTDEWWNMVSLMFIVTNGILREELWGEVFDRNTESEVLRFGNKAVQAVNSIIAQRHPRSLLTVGNVEGLQTSLSLKFDNGSSLGTSLDLWGIRKANGKEIPILTKFKFAPAVSKDKDIESLSQAIGLVYQLYAKKPFEIGTLAYEDFPEQVIVYRISLENRTSQALVYTKKELWDGQDIVKATVKNALNLINGELELMHTPGDHCIKCPFLNTCSLAEFKAETVEEHYLASTLLKQKVKVHETEVKDYVKKLASEDLDRVLENKTSVLVPFRKEDEEGNSFGVVQLSQTTTVIKSRKKDAPSNREILKILIESGLVSGEDDDVTEPKITLSPKLVEMILKEIPEWTEYFKESNKISTKILNPKDVKKIRREEAEEAAEKAELIKNKKEREDRKK